MRAQVSLTPTESKKLIAKAVVNMDDPAGKRFVEAVKGDVITFGISSDAALRAPQRCHPRKGLHGRLYKIPGYKRH